MNELHIPKVAILASGSGTTAEAYARAIHNGVVEAEIGLVVSNREDAGILQRAKHWNRDFGFDVGTAVINARTHPDRKQGRGQTLAESEAICSLLDTGGFACVALLGYMRIINGALIDEYGFKPDEHTSKYQARMINTHPGPLPLTADTHGDGAAARALAGYDRKAVDETTFKHTVHVVAQGVDTGPKIVEHPVPMLPDDTPDSLFARTQLVEKATIPYAIDKFLREQAEYRTSNN